MVTIDLVDWWRQWTAAIALAVAKTGKVYPERIGYGVGASVRAWIWAGIVAWDLVIESCRRKLQILNRLEWGLMDG